MKNEKKKRFRIFTRSLKPNLGRKLEGKMDFRERRFGSREKRKDQSILVKTKLGRALYIYIYRNKHLDRLKRYQGGIHGKTGLIDRRGVELSIKQTKALGTRFDELGYLSSGVKKT